MNDNIIDIEKIDSIIDSASAATDNGDYEVALQGFKQALESAKSIFGSSTELAELEQEIFEIRKMLDG